MPRKSFLQKALASCVAFTSVTIVQNAAAVSYQYDKAAPYPGGFSMRVGDTMTFYTTNTGPNLTAGGVTVGFSIYGSGALYTITGGASNKLIFGNPIGFDDVGALNSLTSASFVAGDGTDAGAGIAGIQGDSLTILDVVAADSYVIATGHGGKGDNAGNNAGGAGGSVAFNGEVTIGNGGMTINADIGNASVGYGGAGGAGGIKSRGGAGGGVAFVGAVSSNSNIDITEAPNGASVVGAGGNAAIITFSSEVKFTNSNAQMRVSAPHGKGGVVYIQGDLTGSASNTVLSLSNNAIASIGTGGGPVTVTGKVLGDSTSTLTTQGVIFTDNVIFGGGGALGRITLADGTSALFQGSVTGALTIGDVGADAAMILSDASNINPPNMNFSGTIQGVSNGVGNLYTTNHTATFDGIIGGQNALNLIGIGYSVDAQGGTSTNPSQALFEDDVNANSFISFGSSVSFTNASLNLINNLVLINTNLTLTANTNDIDVTATDFYVADGLAPIDIDAAYILNETISGAPSSITIRGSQRVSLPNLISGAAGNHAQGYPIDTVTFGMPGVGAPGDSVAVTAPSGLDVTTLNLGTTGALDLQNVTLLSGAHTALTLNVNASNDPQSTIQLTIDSNSASTTSATVNLGTNLLTAGGTSNITLAGKVAINTTFDGTSAGRIVVDGARSAINIAGGSKLNITLDANNEAYVAPVEIKVLENTLNAQLQARAGSSSELIDVQNMNLLRPTIWTYDPSSYTIKGAQGAAPVMPARTSRNALNLANVLINSPANPTIISITKQLGSAPTLAEVVEGIEAMVISSGAEQSNAEALSIRNMALQERLLLIGDHVGNSSKFTEGDGGVSAGGSYEKIRGVWASGFVQKVKQKAYSDTQGYKMLSRGSNLGADITISDNSLIGITWTNAHSVMKHKNNRTEGKSKVATNIFSLYSFTGLSNDWFLQGDISYGSSSTCKRATRFDNTLIKPTQARYKSHFYGADVQLIKQIKRGNFLLQPTGGLSYTYFSDDGYQEYAGAQNWGVKERRSYNIEALLGGRASYSIDGKNDWLFRPYISGYSHIAVKDKKGKIHSSMDGLLNISFQATKASSAWYSTGAGIYAYKGNGLEVAATWELQLDKKYVGNIGTLKVRLEF